MQGQSIDKIKSKNIPKSQNRTPAPISHSPRSRVIIRIKPPPIQPIEKKSLIFYSKLFLVSPVLEQLFPFNHLYLSGVPSVPFSSSVFISLTVSLIHMSDFRYKRIIRIRISQERRNRKQNFGNS